MLEARKSRTALITGGSNGIGLAIAKKFSENGLKVGIADIADPEVEINDVHYKYCDVGNAKDVDSLFAWATEKTGLPDILVINAGRGIQEKLIEGDPEKWQQIINTNVMGALRCIRAFVPPMVKNREGNVVVISSVSANNPHPYGAIYSASKTALEVIAETLRLETLPHVNVTVISPGITDTGFFSNQISGDSNVEDLNMGAIQPEEIAEDVFYAINKNKGTSINKIITRPLAQNF